VTLSASKRLLNDFSVSPIDAVWEDTAISGFGRKKQYVVETNAKVTERCLLMTTDPGDLVLDPTCGSGTTANVAESWGRRWITVDVSRVALAIARQRLLTAKFDYCKLRPTSAADVQRNPDGAWLTDPAGQIQGSCTFDCKTVPHVTLKSIAQNQALDPIFAKWEPILAERLTALNKALMPVTKELRQNLALKLAAKQKAEGKKAITDADRRRWELPEAGAASRRVPEAAGTPLLLGLAALGSPVRHRSRLAAGVAGGPDRIPQNVAAEDGRGQHLHRGAGRIRKTLWTNRFVERGKVRVSGPFTMEGIIRRRRVSTRRRTLAEDAEARSPVGGAPEELEVFGGPASTAVGPGGTGPSIKDDPQNAEAYLDRMIRLLREDGVRFPENKVMKFSPLERETGSSAIHGRGAWANGDKKERLVAVIIGPQYGALNA